jgi:alkaline phosphatase D
VKLFNQEQFPTRDPRYQTVHWGKNLQVWFLEGRDFRSPNKLADGPEKTILGEKQKAWLFKSLNASEAKFKLVFSPTPIVGPDRKNKKDNHANNIFAHEGKELRDKLAQYKGLIVLCGDRHWQYASHDKESDLWEFGCGPGSEEHQLGWKPDDKRPVHRFLRVAGGFLSGEIKYTGKQCQLTLQHRKVNGDVVSEFKFPVKSEDVKPAN